MMEKQTFFKQVRLLLVVLFVAIAAPSVSNSAESAKDGVQRCGLIDDTSARLACYDQLGGSENSVAAKVVEPTAVTRDVTDSELLTERHKQPAEPALVFVNVTSCIKRGGNKKYTFYLEDGQVWKQTSDKRLDFKDCNFGVSIIKDFFGYKMQLQDNKKKFRVTRIH
jgi:hypothetical protein